MTHYMDKLFPVEAVFGLLSLNGDVKKREFAGQNMDKRHDMDVSLAWQSRFNNYNTADEWRKACVKLKQYKTETGAVYNLPFSSRLQGEFHVEGRELVFDIDLTDYKSSKILITDCEDPGTEEFEKSWKMARLAMRVLEKILRECFGFEDLFWFWSGRRGLHCYVLDDRAFKLTRRGRSAIMKHLMIFSRNTVNLWGEFEENASMAAFHSGTMHPTIQLAYDIITEKEKKYFFELADEQEWFAMNRIEETLVPLSHEPDLVPKVKTFLSQYWREAYKRANKSVRLYYAGAWECIEAVIEEHCAGLYKDRSVSSKRALDLKYKQILWLTYPRLDTGVTTDVGHLLKAPFSIHQKTGRACVYIEQLSIDTFKPSESPLVHNLLEAQPLDIKRFRDSVRAFKAAINVTRKKKASTKERKESQSLNW